VIGTPVIFNDDSILLCDTTLAPVTINLLDIPNDYWNTPWKLYVVDKSNNASVNNITINAGAGQTINGASSITLSVNGECALIRIVGNTQYIGQLSASGATIGGHIIQDEGTSLPQRPFLNFVGPGVVASDGAGKSNVFVSGGTITVTYAQLTTLANANGLFVGTNYSITDAEFGSTPIIPTNVVVTAITTNKVSLTGQGIFFNADYQGVGDYSGVPTYNSNQGVWETGLAPALGDVVIWSNFMYLNITGANGATNPELDLVNWQLIPYSVTKGYILEIDTIEYEQSTNYILTRTDRRLNTVERAVPTALNSLNRFMWGNDSVLNNSVVKFSCFDICNSLVKSTITNNIIIGSEITLGAVNNPCSVESVYGNTITNSTISFSDSCKTFNTNTVSDSVITITTNDGNIDSNTIINQSALLITTNSGVVQNNQITASRIIIQNNTINGTFKYNNFSMSSGLNVSIINDGTIEYNDVLTYSLLVVASNFGAIGNFDPKEGGNIIEQHSSLQLETNNGSVAGNNFKNRTAVNISLAGVITSNTWDHVTFTLGNATVGGVAKTTAVGTSFSATNLSKQINSGIADFGINTIGYELDCSDPAIFNGGTNTLTIPGNIAGFFGFYTLKNAGGITINKIVNLSSGWSTMFVNNAGNTTFNSVAIAGAVATQIVSTSGAAAFVVKYRLNGTDSISIQLNGTFCAVTQTLIYT
jgi:hypothetical protein